MAAPLEATSQWQAMNFYIYQQTINLAITPVIAAGNFAPDPFVNHRHKTYAFILPTLLGLLQVQSAATTITSPTQVHPVTTQVCVFGIFGYYLAFMAWLRLPRYATQLSIAMAAFGSFSMASLLALLLPHSWWHIRYIFYVLLAMVELQPVLTVLYDRYVIRRFSLAMRRSWWPNSAGHLLPLTHTDLREHNHAYMF